MSWPGGGGGGGEPAVETDPNAGPVAAAAAIAAAAAQSTADSAVDSATSATSAAGIALSAANAAQDTADAAQADADAAGAAADSAGALAAGKQAADATLTALAGLDGTGGDKGVYFTGPDAAGTYTLTAAGRTLLAAVSAAAQLAVVGGQPADATLTALAALAWSSGTQVPALTAADTLALLTVGTGANNLVQLNGSSQLPAVSGALLTNLPASGLIQRNWTGGSAITTVSAAGAGGVVTGDVAGWFNLGWIHRLKLVANSNTVAIEFKLFADAARTVQLYSTTSALDAYSSAYEDLVGTHYRDDDATAKFHYKITNNGGNASTFTISPVGIGE